MTTSKAHGIARGTSDEQQHCLYNTNFSFQINLWFTDKCLEGELRIDTELDYAYHVFEKEHQFLKMDGQFYRKNEIFRDKILKFQSGKIVETELITKNFARVTYTPADYANEQKNGT